MGTWTNSDGLTILFGTTQATKSQGGHVDKSGPSVFLVADITLADLTDASAAVGSGLDSHEIPKGAMIRSFTTEVLVAAVGVSATLDLGIIKAGTAGTDDPDGFDVDIATATLTPAGASVTGDGDLVNTVLDAHYHLAASFETAAFTAGKVRVTVEYAVTSNREDQ